MKIRLNNTNYEFRNNVWCFHNMISDVGFLNENFYYQVVNKSILKELDTIRLRKIRKEKIERLLYEI